MSYSSDRRQSKSDAAQPVTQRHGSASIMDQRASAAAHLQLKQKIGESPVAGASRSIKQLMTDEELAGAEPAQLMADEEETLQGKFEPVQRAEFDDDEDPFQGGFAGSATAQLAERLEARPNNTGLPDNLKSGIEKLSGMSMDHVKVHYNSAQPAQLNAHAYAQGSDIHVGPGQERHLPHESWHVVQQAQGRVRPTVQMKPGVTINDDSGLEAEADLMGAQAMQLKPTTAAPLAARSTQKNERMQAAPAQRVIRYGEPYSFITGLSEPGRLEELRAKVAPTRHGLLDMMRTDENVHAFDSIDELAKELNGLSEVTSLPKIMRARSFRAHAALAIPLHMRVANWLLAELGELAQTIANEEERNALTKQRHLLTGLADLDSTAAAIDPAYDLLQSLQMGMFKVDKAGATGGRDGNADIDVRKYGFHLTKLHNIPSIAQRGLDPGMGGGDGGSVQASTSDQVKGSIATSVNKVAFGLAPEIFGTYIQQFLDRRQMIENAPELLKPAMLRFVLSDEVRASAQEMITTGDVDYMDGRAVNSRVAILPEDIEVLTDDGWVPIGHFSLAQGMVKLRDDQDDSRVHASWEKSSAAIFTYKEMLDGNIDVFAGRPDNGETARDRADLIASRDKKHFNIDGIDYVFRGATMQTSGNRGTWEYAFTVAYKKTLKNDHWLHKRIRAYKEKYGDVAAKHLNAGQALLKQPPMAEQPATKAGKKKAAARPATEVKTVPAPDASGQLDRFKPGKASGEGMNCLLDTISQLIRASPTSDPTHVQTMRQILRGLGLAQGDAMIDFYGGAGMQLANDLNIRIQVFERTEHGVVRHPVMGISGRLVHIEHKGNHFTPLWPI